MSDIVYGPLGKTTRHWKATATPIEGIPRVTTNGGSTLIAEQFNKANQSFLWELQAYHGRMEIRHSYCYPTGQVVDITANEADLHIEKGRNIYANVPWDSTDPHDPFTRHFAERAKKST